MKIHFYGAAQTVTGSRYLFEINGQKLLLECGLYQGKRAESYLRNQTFQFNPADVDAMVLSHAHIDHSGNLPNLVKSGYRGRIFCTPATADLADIMIMDSAHIQESDAEYLNKKLAKRGQPPVEPLYTMADAAQVSGQLERVVYQKEFEPVPGVTVQLFDAGHILGSAAISMKINENNRLIRFWFSGDIGRPGLPLVKDPILPEEVDYLMMESTYGDKHHPDPRLAFDELKDVVNRTINRHGKVIIPAFAVGRTQELVFGLNEMMSNREIPRIPIYVDSPLAVNTTDIYRNHTECMDEETAQFVREFRHPALDFDQLHYVRTLEESKALNDRDDPMIIMSASGMAETGRILHHLKNNIENKRNTIVIVSWQAPDTLGRRLADRDPVVKIFGEEYHVRAEVATIGGLSAHADQDFLLKYAENARKTTKQILMVHGEPPSSRVLMDLFKEKGLAPVRYPYLNEAINIES